MPNTDDFSGRPMPSSFDENHDFYNEKALSKIFRKLKEEPLIPLGTALTVIAFTAAYRATRRGDAQTANKMFRYRVGAQAFTVVAMVAGSMYFNKDREATKELRKLKEDRDNEEKRQKWIRELEARDEEEKRMKAKILKKRAAKAGAADAMESKEEGSVIGKMGLAGWGKQGDAPPAETADKPATTKAEESSKPVVQAKAEELAKSAAPPKVEEPVKPVVQTKPEEASK